MHTSSGTHAVVRARNGVVQSTCDVRHSTDANNAFDRKIGLVRERTREVVGGDLIGRYESFFYEELGPLIQKAGLQSSR